MSKNGYPLQMNMPRAQPNDEFPATPFEKEFPFKCVLSLAPLIKFWNQQAGGAGGAATARANIAKTILAELKAAPELLEPIADWAVLSAHKELVEQLLSVAIPPASQDRDYYAAIRPFHFQSFYATALFECLHLFNGERGFSRANVDAPTMALGRLLHAFLFVAKTFYGFALELEFPIIFTFFDPTTGLDRHFQITFDPRFVEIKKIGSPPPLTEEAKKCLNANPTDLNLWMELIPPAHYEFHGFTIIRAIEVTDREVLSALKRDLIERDSILSDANFIGLQEKLQTFLRQRDLILGLAAIHDNQVFLLNYGHKIEKHCLAADSMHYNLSDFAGTIHERAARQRRVVVIDDLATYSPRTEFEDMLIANGIRNILVAPLFDQEELVGTLDLRSPHAGALNQLGALKLAEVLSLFAMAIRRSMEDLNTRMQAIIKEKCTAIHPAVEWRFRKAALNLIKRQQATGVVMEMEPIAFENVYPLFGVSDIRGSSTKRNAAIQADLCDHLALAQEIILLAQRFRPLPLLEELAYRIDKNLAAITAGLRAGDEMSILDFVHSEVESIFDHLQDFGESVREKIEAYRAIIDSESGALYRKRKEFEESVTQIADAISAHLDAEQEKAQAMFPHYFEKHKTDGVDHGMYIGASLVDDRKFDLLYLHNLRLWQLMTMCGIARKCEQLKPHLPEPLETAHLILVQNTPLSIRFRLDEKQFDVDGAYNVRYEIMKKRIDKAKIKNSGERLTQPGKIAIVYSQAREAMEYRRYIDYLHASGHLTGEVEEAELEALQGVQGLRALRVTVNLHEHVDQQAAEIEAVEEVVKAMTLAAA
jgi:hypothetical protein